MRDGRTFSTRRVSTSQGGVLISEALVSFIEALDGDDYQQPMGPVTEPESLPAVYHQLVAHAGQEYSQLVRNRVFEMRYIDLPPRIAVDAFAADRTTADGPAPAEAVCRLWLRISGDVPAELLSDSLLSTCVLAYASHWTILDPVQVGIGKTWLTLDAMASLDHTMWFHRPVDFSDWLLYDQRSPSAVGGRGLGSGTIYNRTGELVCSVAQEGYLGRRR